MEVDYQEEHRRMLCILERIHRWTGDILDPVRRAGPTHSGYKELETEATQYIDAGKGENSNFQKSAEQKRAYVERLNTGWDETI